LETKPIKIYCCVVNRKKSQNTICLQMLNIITILTSSVDVTHRQCQW